MVLIVMTSLLAASLSCIALTIEGSETILSRANARFIRQFQFHAPDAACDNAKGRGAPQSDRRAMPNLMQNFLSGFVKEGALQVENRTTGVPAAQQSEARQAQCRASLRHWKRALFALPG